MPCCPNPVYFPVILDCDGNTRPIRCNEFLRLPVVVGGGREVKHIDASFTAPWSIILLCDATSAAITVTLPRPDKGLEIDIKKIDSSVNAITIDGEGSDTIDGSLTQIITTQWDSATLVADGTSWFII